MGMYGTLRWVTQEELSAIRANPDAAYALVFGPPEKRAEKEERESKLYWAIVDLQKRLLLDTGVQERYAAASRRGEPMEKADQEAYDRYRVEMQKLLEEHTPPATEPDSVREIGLDKAWDGLHFLLTGRQRGRKKPWALAILGGKAVPDRHDVMSFGDMLLVTAPQAAEVAAALATLPVEELISRYDAAKMQSASIYAMGTNADQDREYLAEYYGWLCKFYAKAAAENCGALFYVT